MEAWLDDHLQNYMAHVEAQIARIPRDVRNLTMREFGQKYNGDMQAAIRGLHSEKIGGEATEIDKATRKRKWIASQEAESEASGSKSVSEDADPRIAKSGACWRSIAIEI